MSNLHQWIIVVQMLLLTSGGGLCGDDDREHVHIKVHIPELHRKHTHFRKMQKHYFHPKKVVKMPEFLEAEMDTTPFNMMSYGMLDPGQSMQFASFPMNMPAIPDLAYGVDNTLEATVLKKPKKNSMPSIVSDSAVSKFHGMKKPSEFMGASPADEMRKFTSPSEEDVSDDYDADSSREAMVLDQRVAGSSYPYMSMVGGSYKLKRPSYANIFEHSAKPYSGGGGGMKWSTGLPADWLGPTTEEDYSAFDRFVSPTTMHIAKAKPLSSSRLKFDRHAYAREPMIAPKKKKPKAEKRHRAPSSSGFRINY